MDTCSTTYIFANINQLTQKESQTSDSSEKILEKLEKLDLNRSSEMLDLKKKLDMLVKKLGQFDDSDFDSDSD